MGHQRVSPATASLKKENIKKNNGRKRLQVFRRRTAHKHLGAGLLRLALRVHPFPVFSSRLSEVEGLHVPTPANDSKRRRPSLTQSVSTLLRSEWKRGRRHILAFTRQHQVIVRDDQKRCQGTACWRRGTQWCIKSTLPQRRGHPPHMAEGGLAGSNSNLFPVFIK